MQFRYKAKVDVSHNKLRLIVKLKLRLKWQECIDVVVNSQSTEETQEYTQN